jgi:hypothetical protein
MIPCRCSTHEVFFAQPNSFLTIIHNHLRLPTLSIFCCNQQPTPEVDPILIIAESESESYVTTDSQSASLSWYKAPIWAYDQIFIPVRNTEYVGQLRVCWYGALSLTRGRVCRLQLLLALARAASGRPPQKTPLPLPLHVNSLLQKWVYRTAA